MVRNDLIRAYKSAKLRWPNIDWPFESFVRHVQECEHKVKTDNVRFLEDLFLAGAAGYHNNHAWEIIETEYGSKVMEVLSRKPRAGLSTDDLWHETLLRIMEEDTTSPSIGHNLYPCKIIRYRGSVKLLNYLVIIAIRLNIQCHRSQAPDKAHDGTLPSQSIESVQPANEAELDEITRLLKKAYSKLSTEQRFLIRMVYGQEMKTKEAAKLLGISKFKANRHLKDAINHLKRALSHEEMPQKVSWDFSEVFQFIIETGDHWDSHPNLAKAYGSGGPRSTIRPFESSQFHRRKSNESVDDEPPGVSLDKAIPSGQTVSPYIPGDRVDNVHFSILSPASIPPGDLFEIDVWAHFEDERLEIFEITRQEMGQRGETLVKSSGPVEMAHKTVLTVRLALEGLIVEETQNTMYWLGEKGKATFPVSVPEDAKPGRHRGCVYIYVEGLEITKIFFSVSVGKKATRKENVTSEIQHHLKAFASYAHADRDEVLARIQGMLKIMPSLDIFIDVKSLRSGQHWEAELQRTIISRDIFYLFWSANARESKWVDREWRYALDKRGIDFIDPCPLVSPEIVSPPPELSAKHFNDWILAYMRWSPPRY